MILLDLCDEQFELSSGLIHQEIQDNTNIIFFAQ